MTSEPTRRRVTPRPAIGLAAAATGFGGSGTRSRATARQALGELRVQHDRADAVEAELLDARPIGEAAHAAAQVVDRGDVEGAVADRDLVEAVGREVLPQAIEGTVGRQVEQRAGQPDLGARGLGHDGMAEVPRAFADEADDSTAPSSAGTARSRWRLAQGPIASDEHLRARCRRAARRRACPG